MISPLEIAAALRTVDSKVSDPTPEQIAIISAPLEPAVVIAGAGSGKTETMSARVLWLVANKIVRPDEILGLTFTRKAAGELSIRVRKRLRQLKEAGLLDKNLALDTSITTYHSYAGRIMSEHAIRLGIDATSDPLGDAALWQMASDIVRNWPDESFTNESAVTTVIDDVIGLAKLVLEHQVSFDDIRREDEKTLAELHRIGGTANEEVRKVVRTAQQRIAILPMVQEFLKRRIDEQQLSFDDQMSIAARIAETFAEACELERAKYKVVLLDEYQDTSQSQVRMLSALFGKGHPVMAVGDPCQAIYTWRGASAGTIGTFAKYFPKSAGQSGAELFNLSITFRNDKKILEIANSISDQIRSTSTVRVDPLRPRDTAGDGEIAYGVFETLDAEAQGIAEYFHKHWFAPERIAIEEEKRTSFAVLVRKRSQISKIESALRERNIPTEVIGVGGLIYVAEVADVLSLMKVVTNPEAGTALMRHLTGPRLALGAKDVAALGAYSRRRAKSVHEDSHSFIAKIAAGNPDSAEADDLFVGSLIDALDEIDQCDNESRKEFSDVGFTRLSRFAADLRRLRSRAGGSIIDLITEIENYLNLDLEVSLRDGTRNGRRHLERFLDEASKFSRSGGSISAFIEWLDVTSKKEGGLKSGAPEVRSDVVQLLTIHTAKGAEWDFVAIPGLAEGTFPSTYTNDPDNWITNEKQIPFVLRGDGDELPVFSLAQCTKDSEASKVIKEYAQLCAAIKKQEEIRLGYVAVTRARTHLLCTTSWWRDGARSVDPSELFAHVADVADKRGGVLLSHVDAPEDGSRNPIEINPDSAYWPRDPLGDRRAAFDAAVALVEKSQPHTLTPSADDDLNSWISDAQALIAEVKNRNSPTIEVELPARISTSTLVALHENPEALALAIRRPIPRSQDPYSRRGTQFHAWVEKQFSAMTLFDDIDLDYFDPIEEDGKLEDLKKAWQSSAYANRTPAAIEVPFESVVAGVLIRGRIDAVYETPDGFEVVDWKTGSKQLGESAAIQLAMYRLAWARLKNIDVSKVSAAFHYVPTSVTDRRADLLDEAALVALIQKYNK
ncbi:MAG: ATP-dependent helicase [Actinobacteria bacterium]|nr:ATP-dependent helicase [Actinomycetota bacterium]NDH81188.1 ATP-dependent helicase [Actinomycetota bacterium]NDH99571.1 ATP-dependent helicase [Actinomycetota bacterium]NDI08002.1 ATP-dependent helicase [Actinomycetota bacterium]